MSIPYISTWKYILLTRSPRGNVYVYAHLRAIAVPIVCAVKIMSINGIEIERSSRKGRERSFLLHRPRARSCNESGEPRRGVEFTLNAGFVLLVVRSSGHQRYRQINREPTRSLSRIVEGPLIEGEQANSVCSA